MHADICRPTDKSKVARFHAVLKELGASVRKKDWGIGVTVWKMKIQGKELNIFHDSWSLDIEGPDDLVNAILAKMKQ